MSLTNWNVNKQISGSPITSITNFCQPWREAVQIASGNLSNSTARIVAPMGPIPKNVTPMPLGKQTVFWYFHPVDKITNSVIVAMINSGSVKYEMRLLFNNCQGEKPALGVGWDAVVCEFVSSTFFILEPFAPCSRVDLAYGVPMRCSAKLHQRARDCFKRVFQNRFWRVNGFTLFLLHSWPRGALQNFMPLDNTKM